MQIRDLIPDDRNANRGTLRGNKAVADSLAKYGAGRSILIDKNGKILAGNKTAKHAVAAGISNVRVIESDGTELIAIRRTDIDITSPGGRELAIADNRSSELGLEWDPEVLGSMAADLDLQPFFTGDELTKIIAPHLDRDSNDGGETEIDIDDFALAHTCPRCRFAFNDK